MANEPVYSAAFRSLVAALGMASDDASLMNLDPEAVMLAGAGIIRRHSATNMATALAALASGAVGRDLAQVTPVVAAVQKAQHASEVRDGLGFASGGGRVEINVHGDDPKRVKALDATVRHAVQLAMDADPNDTEEEPLSSAKIVWAHVYLEQLQGNVEVGNARAIADAAVRDLTANDALEAAGALLIA